ncbi:putative transcriptional regulatory protein [Colletotrichum gloeosporioides]|uniref:Putative transcriptional regulatory protein n=1 Tax=Colletotrichum gloeosporioides TaxID=474922 RepID=A0A8H4FHW6_COLGL|nr:putative transcriptional regulatory protein [Colletotrichum gloeosporioides]KAF3802847.1 putative transcriptional regulatory protein [Colletotrichum gloeosporioides]
MEKTNVKRISCKRCQQRKIRCSRIFPCTNCSAASAKCEFRESDFKRPPVSREYVAALESRIASLEGFLARLKEASNDERNQILDEVEIKDYVPSFSSLPLEDEAALSEALTKATLQETLDGSMIYHGPTSIFQNDYGDTCGSSSGNSKKSPFQDDRSNLINQTMRLCLGLFFYWQYPLFMFIDREAFVAEFEDNPIDGDFCSPPLIYAAAAIGALMSKDPDIRSRAQGFADTAQSILTTEGLSAPRPTSVQALLCCGYYEVGQGNISRGWMFAGMAFRMGQDIGFQREPTHWGSEDRPNSKSPFPFDNEFRRRIYWGCFLSDKIFSLFLGRPTFMYENDADVNLSEPLPHDPPVWENWLFSHDLGFLKTVRPAGPKLTLLFNQQIELARIIHDMLSTTFAPRKKTDAHARRWTEVSLNKLNARLVAWHEALPTNMRWKKWFTNKDNLQVNVAILHTRISLNLPFIASIGHMPSLSEDKPENEKNPLAQSFRVCRAGAEGIVDVLQRFKSEHTLGNAPLLFVGGCILAMNAILVTCRHMSNPSSLANDTLLPILDDALQDMAHSWSLAGEARLKFKSVLDAKTRRSAVPSTEIDKHVLGSRSASEVPMSVPVLHEEFSITAATTSAIASAPAPNTDSPGPGVPIDPTLITPGDESLVNMGIATQSGDLETPGQHVWEPMSVLDSEAAYWAGVGGNFLAESDLDFFDGVPEFDWSEQPPIP